MPYWTIVIFKYFEDNGENFYNLWLVVPKFRKTISGRMAQKLQIFIRLFLIIVIIGGLFPYGYVLYMNEEERPWGFIAYEFFLLFVVAIWNLNYGGTYLCIINLFILSVVSYAAAEQIKSIASTILERLLIYDETKGNGDNDVLIEMSKQFSNSEKITSKGIRTHAGSLAMFVATGFLGIILITGDQVLNAIAGERIHVTWIMAMGIQVIMLIYCLYVLLVFSIYPSIEYKLFVRELHAPNILHILSKCYSGNQATLQYFFAGLELHRERLIWKVFGVEITSSVYERVIGSLVSFLLLTMGFMLRASV